MQYKSTQNIDSSWAIFADIIFDHRICNIYFWGPMTNFVDSDIKFDNSKNRLKNMQQALDCAISLNHNHTNV